MKVAARLTPALLAGAAAAAIFGAPIASADTSESCGSTGGGTVCQSPGNVQIDDDASPAQFYPYGGEAFLLGGGAIDGGGIGFHGSARPAAGAHGGGRR